MNKINLIFDFDGTIFDSYESIIDWVFNILLKFNIKADPSYLKQQALYHDVNYVFNEYINKYNLSIDEVSNYKKTINQNIDLVKPYPYLIDVLNNPLFNSFIYTHRGITSNILLERYNIKDKFIEVVDSTYKFKRKPSGEAVRYLVDKYHLDPNNTYYVGDRVLDIECGIDAGVKTIFIKSSNLDIDYSKANFIINNLNDLNNLDF